VKQHACERFRQVEQNREEDENFGKADGKERCEQSKTMPKLLPPITMSPGCT